MAVEKLCGKLKAFFCRKCFYIHDKDVKVKTVGGVIEPGEDVIEIVPYEDKLLVEANINPKDVVSIDSHLHSARRMPYDEN